VEKTVIVLMVFELYLLTQLRRIMKELFLLISGLFFCQMLLAQVTLPDTLHTENDTLAILKELNVNQDPRLEKMLNWDVENNKERNGIEGYRVEIFFSSKMDAYEKARETKIEFLSKFPDYPVHVVFVAPNFRVRVGDFRTKSEAWKLYKKIEKMYPAAFVVQGKIDFPILKPLNYE
jgi:hypothetical protein